MDFYANLYFYEQEEDFTKTENCFCILEFSANSKNSQQKFLPLKLN